MRLNLGCGKKYQPNYINIDAYDTTIADQQHNVLQLPYPPNNIEQINAIQLIEHLGFFPTCYALAHWYQILKPQGTLLIETPDITTTFTQYLNATQDQRKKLITWIYGLESPGMNHLFCFPLELLQQTLQNTGFTITSTKQIEPEPNHPTLQIHCTKNTPIEPYQSFSEFRTQLLNKHLIDFTNYLLMFEIEQLINNLQNQLHSYQKKPHKTSIQQLIINGSIHNPTITYEFIQILINNQILPKKTYQQYLTQLEFLIKINLPNILTYLIQSTNQTQKNIYSIVMEMGKQTVKNLLTSKNKQKIKQSLRSLAQKSSETKTHFFSPKLLENQAYQHFQKGIKHFYQNNNDEALTELKQAAAYAPNNVLYMWNLARIYNRLDINTQAYTCYNHIQKLLQQSEIQNKKTLLKSLSIEKKNFSNKEYIFPITKL